MDLIRERDLHMLRELGAIEVWDVRTEDEEDPWMPEHVTPEEHKAFGDMLTQLEDAGDGHLTLKQRGWVEAVCSRLQINTTPPSEVVRGAEVPIIPLLRPENLPKKPPGRR